jgi:hypothetical protein
MKMKLSGWTTYFELKRIHDESISRLVVDCSPLVFNRKNIGIRHQ